MLLLMSELCLGGGDLQSEMQKPLEGAEEGGGEEPTWDAYLGQKHSLVQHTPPQSEMVWETGQLIYISCSVI